MTTPLIDAIKKAKIQAVKDKDEIKKTLLSTLIGEAEMKGKNDGNRPSTDADFISVMKKFITNIDDTIKMFADYPVTKAEDIAKRQKDEAEKKQEKAILMEFMPKMPAQMSEEQLRAEIAKIKSELSLAGPKGMGVLMKEMKARFEGKFDGGLASKIAKEVLV